MSSRETVLHLQGDWCTIRRGRTLNRKQYENDNFSLELPWMLSDLDAGIAFIDAKVKEWEQRTRGLTWMEISRGDLQILTDSIKDTVDALRRGDMVSALVFARELERVLYGLGLV